MINETTITKLKRAKELWNTWDIRVFMLTSLLIQALLTCLAPRRKRSASGFLNFSMWLLYLSADAVALFTIGLIANSDTDSPQKEDLLAFWAPFLLLHLGGPDSITALALEDNELWHRHALQFVSQLLVTLFVFGRSLRRNTGLLWPTLLMFIDGVLKYIERTEALYFASMDSFRASFVTKPEAGPDYARFMEEYSAAASAHLPITIQDQPFKDNTKPQRRCGGEDSNPINNAVSSNNEDGNVNVKIDIANHSEDENVMIKEAYHFYMKFKGLLADSFLTLKDRDESRSFYLNEGASKVFKLVVIELNFIYDVFYTKVFLLQRKQAYLRIVSFLAVVASLLIFSLKNKANYHNIDVGITFALLGGAIALDTFVLVMFILSDWWIIITSQQGISKRLRSLFTWLFPFWSCTTHCRWSQSISKYNLLERCFKNPPSILKYIFIKQIKDALIGLLYVQNKNVDEKLVVNVIVKELQKKAEIASDLKTSKDVYSARGNLVLENDYFLVSEYLSPWTVDVDYDESVLIWHLATDICYWTSHENVSTDDEDRNFCKELSDYMSYLLLRQQSLVSLVVGMSENRFEDTCAEARKFMSQSLNVCWFAEICSKEVMNCSGTKSSNLTSTAENQTQGLKETELKLFKQFCYKVLKVKAHVPPIVAKGDKSKSVLFDACRLAEQLKMFGKNQWEITRKVWIELLCYAATRCPPRSHIAQLRRGGELITLVWLLMAHLGLGERFLQNQGFGWTKLIIHK